MSAKFFNIQYHNISDFIDDEKIWYVVIVASYKWKQIYVKHKERKTWELPWWHREQWEILLDSAKRELYEETGAIDFEIKQVWHYSLEDINKNKYYGGVFFAEIISLWKLPNYEVEEVQLFDTIPWDLTYQELHSIISKEVVGKG